MLNFQKMTINNFEQILQDILLKNLDYFFIGCTMVINNYDENNPIILNINGYIKKYETDEHDECENLRMTCEEQLKFLLILKRLIANQFINDKIEQLSKVMPKEKFQKINEELLL